MHNLRGRSDYVFEDEDLSASFHFSFGLDWDCDERDVRYTTVTADLLGVIIELDQILTPAEAVARFGPRLINSITRAAEEQYIDDPHGDAADRAYSNWSLTP